MVTTEAKEPLKIDPIQLCLIDIEKSGTGKFNMGVYNIPAIINARFVLTHEIGLIQKKESNLSSNQRMKTIQLYDEVLKEKNV